MKFRSLLLNEKLIYTSKHGIEIYKNPKSLKNFKHFIRGISDRKGDLYICDNDLVHYDLSNILKDGGFSFPTGGSVYNNTDYVLWQKESRRSTFYFSDSQDSYYHLLKLNKKELKIEKINKLIELVRKKNPKLKFEKIGIYD